MLAAARSISGNLTIFGAANIIPSPIETVIKSINQAINLSAQLANTIVSAVKG